MPEQFTAACGAVRDVLPCVLDADHHDAYHQDAYGYRWPTVAAEQATAEPEQAEADPGRLVMLDGRDALAAVIIRPVAGDPESISVEATARGMSKAVAAHALREAAARFDAAAVAEGDTPITPEEAAAEQNGASK